MHTVMKFWAGTSILPIALLTTSISYPQKAEATLIILHQTCETTAIYQPGIGWIPGSEITTCDSWMETINDGSSLVAQLGNECGGAPCPEAPPDDEGGNEDFACEFEQAAESEMDQRARETAEDIRGRNTPENNPNNAEWGAFILRLDNGEVVRVNIISNNQTAQISLTNMYEQALAQFPGIDASNIIGILHLQPREAGPGFENVDNIGELSPLDYTNTMPSHPNLTTGPNDWTNARNFLLDNGRTSVSDVSHYILGPDGVLRQYNYADGHPAERSTQYDEINGAAANAEGNCDEMAQ